MNKITYVSLLFCVYDLSLYFLSKFVLDDDHTVVIVCDTVYLILYALLCFLCFVFAIAELKMIKLSAKSLVLSAVPGIITIFAAVIIMLMLSVSENTSEIKSLLLGCGIILTCYYVVIFIFQLFYFILKKKMRFNSKSITLTTLYFFFILLSIALQWFFFEFYLPQIFFTFFALFAFMTLQNAQRLYDSLTGIMNRRGLDELIDYYSDNIPKNSLFIMMLDINNFKSINDTFGHTVGDDALRDAAKILKRSVDKFSEKPHLCRYGGDEFLIIAEDFGLGKIKRLKRFIEQETEKINKQEGKRYYLKFSSGVAFAKIEDGDELHRLIHIADEAMYKEKGKNKARR